MRFASEIPSAFNFNASSKKKGAKVSKKKQQSLGEQHMQQRQIIVLELMSGTLI